MERKLGPLRLIIVDDQALFCQLAREILSGSSEFLVVGEAYSAEGGFQLIQDSNPTLS